MTKFLGVGLLLVMGTTICAADLSGRWMLTLDPDFSGNHDTLDCTLKQEGATLKVECGGPPILGEVKNHNVTLQFKTGENGSATATLTGVVDQAGTTVKGTWHLDPDNRNGNFEFKKR